MGTSVIVIGGGVAGLVAARDRARRGDTVTLLEASPQCGGALRRQVLDGVAVDVGAEAFGISRPETRALVDELGLDVIAPRRSDARLLLDDGLHDMPHAMLGIPTDLSSPEVRAIIGDAAAGRARELDARRLDASSPDVTLGVLVRSRMGDDVADRILTPVVAGVHAADPDRIEAEAIVPGLLRALEQTGSLAGAAARLRASSGVPGSAIAGLQGGMTTLVDALTSSLRAASVDIRLSTRASGIERTTRGWTVMAGDAPLTADSVVVATDAPTSARLLGAFPAVSRALAGISVGDVVVCAAVVDAAELDDDPVGSGLLVAPGHPSVRAKALTHASAKWEWIRAAYGPGRHLVRLSYGRDGRIDEALDDLPRIVASDISAVFGLPSPAIRGFSATRWDRSLVLPHPGHRARVRAVQDAAADIPSLQVVGAGLGGNGLAGTIALARSGQDSAARNSMEDWDSDD